MPEIRFILTVDDANTVPDTIINLVQKAEGKEIQAWLVESFELVPFDLELAAAAHIHEVVVTLHVGVATRHANVPELPTKGGTVAIPASLGLEPRLQIDSWIMSHSSGTAIAVITRDRMTRLPTLVTGADLRLSYGGGFTAGENMTFVCTLKYRPVPIDEFAWQNILEDLIAH